MQNTQEYTIQIHPDIIDSLYKFVFKGLPPTEDHSRKFIDLFSLWRATLHKKKEKLSTEQFYLGISLIHLIIVGNKDLLIALSNVETHPALLKNILLGVDQLRTYTKKKQNHQVDHLIELFGYKIFNSGLHSLFKTYWGILKAHGLIKNDDDILLRNQLLLKYQHKYEHMPVIKNNLNQSLISLWMEPEVHLERKNAKRAFKELPPLEKPLNDKFPRSVMLACGNQYSILLESNGQVRVCGLNFFGQLGLGDTENRYAFAPLNLNEILQDQDSVHSVYSGGCITAILSNNGLLLVCGSNRYGQLGLGDNNNRSRFHVVNFKTALDKNDAIKSIHMGSNHTFILTEKNQLLACGSNDVGQLGIGNTKNQNEFVAVNLEDVLKEDVIVSVDCGTNHSFILTQKGRLLGCGNNDDGQLGMQDIKNTTKFVEINLDHVLTNDDAIHTLSCGHLHSIILTKKGFLLGTGDNTNGQFGTGNTDNSKQFVPIDLKEVLQDHEMIESVHCAREQTFIHTNKNRLLSSGCGRYGQLGHGNTKETNAKFLPVVLTEILQHNENIASFHCGTAHSFILTTKNRLLGCGRAEYGELGIGKVKGNITTFTEATGLNLTCSPSNELLSFEQKKILFKLENDTIEIDFSLSGIPSNEIKSEPCKGPGF